MAQGGKSMNWVDWIIVIDAILIIILTMMQSSKSHGASGAIMGGNSAVFTNVKERGPEKIISNFTLVCGIAFFILAIMRVIWFKSTGDAGATSSGITPVA